MIGIQWPLKMFNNKLYKITGTKPLSITITERNWKLLEHILRLPVNCPARKAMKYYFEERTNKIVRGKRETTIVSTVNEDIMQAKGDDITCPVTLLYHKSDYEASRRRPRTKALVKDCKASCKIGLFQMIELKRAL